MANKNKEKKTASRSRNRKIGNAITYAILIIISIIWLFPFVGLVLQSFRSYASEYGGMVAYLMPKEFSLDNYTYLFSGDCSFVRWYLNTLIVAVCAAIFNTFMVLSVAYALSRLRFRGRTLLMQFWLILGMFPGFLTMICMYFLLQQFGLTQAGAIPGLVLVTVASSGMGYYVAKGFLDTMPKALDESARLDGASNARIAVTIILPLAKPIIIYTALTAFMAPWCDYVFASYVAFGYSKSYNVAVALQRWVWTNDYQGYFTRFCAGGVLVAIPVLCLQKYYVEGVTGGAVKG